MFSISMSLELIKKMAEMDGFIDLLIESSDTFLSSNSNGLDILLDFMTNFYASFSSSFDSLVITTIYPYSIGNTFWMKLLTLNEQNIINILVLVIMIYHELFHFRFTYLDRKNI